MPRWSERQPLGFRQQIAECQIGLYLKPCARALGNIPKNMR